MRVLRPLQVVGLGPDFYDLSLVDGFNLPISSHVTGGFNVSQPIRPSVVSGGRPAPL